MDSPRSGEPSDEPVEPGASAAPTASGASSRAGRDLPRAIGVGLVLGALAITSLLTYRATFILIIVAAVSASIWELRGTLARARGIQLSWLPVTIGSAATIGLA